MNKEIDNIFSLYNEFEKHKKAINEVMVKPSQVNYSSIDFDTRAQSDEINKALLDDIEKAAKNAGVEVKINYAKTGHGRLSKSGQVSRHYTNQAVDISHVDGYPVSPSNRRNVDRFVDALVGLGYVKNQESGNPKSVLTFGFPGHDNHIHVSNTSSGPSSQSGETNKPNNLSQTDNFLGSDEGPELTKKYDFLGLNQTPELTKTYQFNNEGKSLQESFGKQVQERSGILIIPADKNKKIYSPVEGKVITGRYRSGDCKNSITIKIKNNLGYLQYCGIKSPKVRVDDSIKQNQLLGITEEDVRVIFYDNGYEKRKLSNNDFDNVRFGEKEKKQDVEKQKKDPQYYDPATFGISSLLSRPFKDKYDSAGNRIEKRWGYMSDKKQVDPWIKDAGFRAGEKVKNKIKSLWQEEVDRIKSLLK